MKTKLLTTVLLLGAIFAGPKTTAQTVSTFRIDARADFDYRSETYQRGAQGAGFGGKYLNLLLNGTVAPDFSYVYRQRLLPNTGLKSFFDGTDYIYLNWHATKNWTFTAGKQVVYIGGFEYDAPPIDVFYWSEFWNNIACFQLGVTAAYTTDDGRHTFVGEWCNSPYATSPASSLFAYNFAWYGKFSHLQTIWSANIIARDKGSYVGYLALGTKMFFPRWSVSLDLMNRLVDTEVPLKDFTIISEARWEISKKSILFAKGGYDQNKAEDPLGTRVRDAAVAPGTEYAYGGLGGYWLPLGTDTVRLHAYAAAVRPCSHGDWLLHANIGLTWRINLLSLIKK